GCDEPHPSARGQHPLPAGRPPGPDLPPREGLLPRGVGHEQPPRHPRRRSGLGPRGRRLPAALPVRRHGRLLVVTGAPAQPGRDAGGRRPPPQGRPRPGALQPDVRGGLGRRRGHRRADRRGRADVICAEGLHRRQAV
ncbi:MAG: hypothetical protein AVDCRST_MAG76-3603, partial [uncultured Acidimicrobiales bacterium]